ncbi:MAG: hypothetical protein QW275_03625 [Candidatus Anstonellaceae archaeon]
MAVIGKNGEERVVGRPVPTEMRRTGILGKVDALPFSEFKKLPLLERLELMAGAFKEKEVELNRFDKYEKLKLYIGRQEKLAKQMFPELLKQKSYNKLVEIFKNHWPAEEAIEFLLNETKQLKDKGEVEAILTAVVQGDLIKEMINRGEVGASFYILEKIVGIMKKVGIKPSKKFIDAVNDYLLKDVSDCIVDYVLLGDIIKTPWVGQSVKKTALKKLPEVIESSCDIANDFQDAAEFIVAARKIPAKTLENAIAVLLKKSSDSSTEEVEAVFKILMTGDDKVKESALKKAIDFENLIFDVVDFYIQTKNERLEKVVEAKMNRLIKGIKETVEDVADIGGNIWYYSDQLQLFYNKLDKKENKQYLPKIKKLLDFALKKAAKIEAIEIDSHTQYLIEKFINGVDIPEKLLKRALDFFGIDVKGYMHPLTGELDLDGIRVALKERGPYY